MIAFAPTFALLLLLVILPCIGAGLFLIVRGIRGQALLSEPHCAGCGYDLRGHLMQQSDSRRCPECGSDLNVPGAVKLARYGRRPRLIAIGAGLLLLPAVLVAAATLTVARAATG